MSEETKNQFIERYVKQIGWSLEEFQKYMVALPCNCEVGGGPTHWAAVRRWPVTIRHHLEFDAPDGTPWPEESPESEEQ